MVFDSLEGAILGSVIGDALGVPAEFMSREELREHPVRDMISGGAHNQPAGTWSDDTSMVLCTMDSMIAAGINYDDQMQRFSRWLWEAENTAHDEVFDVGGTTKHAIFQFVKKTPALDCGETAENSCGNGSLMRIIPTALYILGRYGNQELDDRAADIIHNTSKCTHAHPKCQVACGIFCSVIFHMANSDDLKTAVYGGVESALKYYRSKLIYASVLPEFETLREIGDWAENDIKSTGYVVHTLHAALWCLLNTKGYPQCVLRAVALGRDTDTTAAVAGALAGFWYGAKQIPAVWERKTAKYEAIKQRVKQFHSACIVSKSDKPSDGVFEKDVITYETL